MIWLFVMVVALGIVAGVNNRSAMVGAVPIVWALWFSFCLWLVR